MSASTSFSAIEKMLKQCAPGYTIRLATHSRVIHFGDKMFRTLPKFDSIENGFVRKLARSLDIEACAALHLVGVVKPPSPSASIAPVSAPSPAKTFKKKK
jgi:hypothetical protein